MNVKWCGINGVGSTVFTLGRNQHGSSNRNWWNSFVRFHWLFLVYRAAFTQKSLDYSHDHVSDAGVHILRVQQLEDERQWRQVSLFRMLFAK